jgi:hypothetical protein
MNTIVETYSQGRGDQYNTGQFYTPVAEVNMLLDKLPARVWRDASFRWFEPSFGEGVFLKEIIKRLMAVHPIKHILEHMIYGVELDRENFYGYVEYIEETYGRFKMNIDCENTLEKTYDIKFDVIVGNPPYNSRDKSIRNSKILHQKFTEYSMDHLNEGGFLLFIIPPIYRRLNHPLNFLWKRCQMRDIHIFSRPEVKTMFDVAANIDCIIVENVPKYMSTNIRFLDGTNFVMELEDNLPYIPNAEFMLFKQLLHNRAHRYVIKSGGGRRTDQQDEEDEEHPYKTFMSRSNRNGFRYRWSSVKRDDYDLRKVVLNQGTTILPFYSDGDCQGKDHTFYIEVDSEEEADELMLFINSDEVQRSSKYWVWSSFAVEAKCLEWIL